MKYRLGIITQEEVPFVVMEGLTDEGEPSGEKKSVKRVYVQGTLMSDKYNQLILDTKSAKEIIDSPDDKPKNE